MPIKTIDKADPKGQFLPTMNDCSIKLPIIITLAPPKRSGTIKFPRLGIKTRIDPPIIPGNDKGKVILTTPVGEEHCLSCNMLESFLLSKGFTTFNLSPSTPANSLVEFIKTIHPTAILISVTLEDNIKPAQRLVKKIIDSNKKLDVFVGGQAFDNNRSKCDAIVIESSTPLEQIPRILSKRKK